MKVERPGYLTASEASAINTLIAVPPCPICDKPITKTKVDPRGVKVPFCCGFFLIPVWQCPPVSVFQIRFNIITSEASPETGIENEILEGAELVPQNIAKPVPETPPDELQFPPSSFRSLNVGDPPLRYKDSDEGSESASPPPKNPEVPHTVTSEVVRSESETSSEYEAIIRQHLASAPDQTATTGKIETACRRERSTFSHASLHSALKRLVEDGKIRNPKRGVYQLC